MSQFSSGEVLTAANLNTAINAPTQNAQTGTTYTFVLLDGGKIVTASNGAAQTYTVPLQSSVAWATNSKIDIVNIGAGTVTIAAAAGVTISGTPLTLATSKGGSLIRTASDAWTFIPFSAGVGNANFTDTATGTYTDSGIDYKYLTLTGSTSVTFDRAGYADVLVVGGGNSGSTANGNNIGGGGGGVRFGSFLVPASTLTVTIGGAGGGTTDLNTIIKVGGGSAGVFVPSPQVSGVGGGGGNGGVVGNAGGYTANGGGAGGSVYGTNSYDGLANSYTNVAVTYGKGGQGSNTTVGPANTGTGGGRGAAGGSGVAVIRVRTN